MKKGINKKDLGIALVIIDILICIIAHWHMSNIEPVAFSEVFNVIYLSRSKLFIIGLFLILLDTIENKNND